ncbi:hypothetical protein [Prosthecobacter sp.]
MALFFLSTNSAHRLGAEDSAGDIGEKAYAAVVKDLDVAENKPCSF